MAVTLVSLGLLAGVALAQTQTIYCPSPGGFGPVVVAPPILLSSLKTVPNPIFPPDEITGVPALRGDLVEYIANPTVAIQLGKALFWDMQAGSDNKTACATCHYHAGADHRDKNQLNKGPNGAYNVGGSLAGPNFQLTSAQFPISPTHDDIAGSQGVRASTFLGITRSGAESTTTPTGFRQVTGKNTPSVINAVFNHRQFWNGRAQPDFNGANPFGSRDTSARVWSLDYRGFPVQVAVSIRNASLASQAVGPALNPVEMSADKRTFPDLGKKLLLVKPLGLQKVDPTDSVFGPPANLADPTAGLKTTYKALIQTAFQPKWWNSNKSVSVGGKSYSMIEANFSLFWGLSIMLYEATLVANDSPMDRYLDPWSGVTFPRPALTNTTPLSDVVTRLAAAGISISIGDILNGLALFELPVALPPSFPAVTAPGCTAEVSSYSTTTGCGSTGVGCIGCHFTAELTSASVRNLSGPGLEPGDVVFKNAGFDLRMERMFMKMDWTPPGPLTPVPLGADGISFDPSTYAVNVIDINGLPVSPIPLPVKTYDAGWYNIGVLPTTDDLGLGADEGRGPWSWTRLFQGLSDPSLIKVPGGGLACTASPPGAPPDSPFAGEVLNPNAGLPILAGPLLKNEATDVDGTFKTAHLRNVEDNGPYFHNGGKSTLAQVVAFYNGGGNFANATKAPAIVPLQLTDEQKKALVAFLVSLTDERVRWQKAPFDHPQLFVPNGETAGIDTLVEIPAVGAAGAATPLERFLNLNPFN